MAQSPRLFPAFPNEIGDAIILHLPFLDLVSGYFVLKDWRAFSDKKDKISKKLFRYPNNVRYANIQARKEFVDKLWQKVYDEVGNDGYILDACDSIDFNPPLDHPDAATYICEDGLQQNVSPQSI
jgi:hypothetical protein